MQQQKTAIACSSSSTGGSDGATRMLLSAGSWPYGYVAPALVIGVPVGFVNVVEAKELFIGGDTPYIIARGRKGGSNVAASIVNALLYQMVHREGF